VKGLRLLTPELALNGVKGWVPIPPWRDESLIDNGVHQKVRKLQAILILTRLCVTVEDPSELRKNF
jgi:hypothetical protein